MKRIILCADDYGQNSAISQAIIELFKGKRISATSCMTNSPYWLAHASWLKPYINQVDIGLHFNLTEGEPVSKEMKVKGFASLSRTLLKTHLNQINRSAIEAELHAQMDLFVQGVGRLPDFIDGHQHVHHMPGIRDALLRVYRDRLKSHGTYIRSVYDNTAHLKMGGAYIKRLLIQFSGAIALKMQLSNDKIPHNSSFSGIYPFSQHYYYHKQFRLFLSNVSDNGLIMCHPGLRNESHCESDSIASSRFAEYNYFQSEQFLKDCDQSQAIISQFTQAI